MITLKQIAEAIANSKAVILDNDALTYPSVDIYEPSLFFSWMDGDGLEYQVNVDEDNFISAELKEKTLVVKYKDGLTEETVEINILDVIPFNFD